MSAHMKLKNSLHLLARPGGFTEFFKIWIY